MKLNRNLECGRWLAVSPGNYCPLIQLSSQNPGQLGRLHRRFVKMDALEESEHWKGQHKQAHLDSGLLSTWRWHTPPQHQSSLLVFVCSLVGGGWCSAAAVRALLSPGGPDKPGALCAEQLPPPCWGLDVPGAVVSVASDTNSGWVPCTSLH